MNVLDIEVVPFGIEQANIAREAYRQFGKGSGHQAQVSFTDCTSYAIGVALDQPLLVRGGGFLDRRAANRHRRLITLRRRKPMGRRGHRPRAQSALRWERRTALPRSLP